VELLRRNKKIYLEARFLAGLAFFVVLASYASIN
jgi:hypothetical protein